jgi:hypothetical protein
MANITGFTIDYQTSDFTEQDGITVVGTFTTDCDGNVENHDDIYMRVNEAGMIRTLEGTFAFDLDAKTFTFVTTQQQLYSGQIVRGDFFQFLFTDANGPGSQDDVTLTTSAVVPLCFYPGTLIATPEGEVAVESLQIGDLVIRQDGTAAPIRWVGRNTVSMIFANKDRTLPIRIKKDALSENVPSRDLLVSPAHAVLVDDVLIQASALVNHSSIIREADVPTVFVYYHVELADHSLIMAENTPNETFIDNVDRMAFDNWAEHEALYGDQVALVEMDLPRAKSQRQVPSAIRQRLAHRATELGYAAVAAA